MLVNRKASLGILVAIVISLGVIWDINSNSLQNRNLQQVGLVFAYISGETEGGTSAAWDDVSDWCIGTSSGMALFSIGSFYAIGTNPVWLGILVCYKWS